MTTKKKEWFIAYLKNLIEQAQQDNVFIDAIVFEKDRQTVSFDETKITVPSGQFKLMVIGFGNLDEYKEKE